MTPRTLSGLSLAVIALLALPVGDARAKLPPAAEAPAATPANPFAARPRAQPAPAPTPENPFTATPDNPFAASASMSVAPPALESVPPPELDEAPAAPAPRATPRARARRGRAGRQPAPAPTVGLHAVLTEASVNPLALVPESGAPVEELPPELVVEEPEPLPAPDPAPVVVTSTTPRPASHLPPAIDTTRALERAIEAPERPRPARLRGAEGDPVVTLAVEPPTVADDRPPELLVEQAATRAAPAATDGSLGAVDDALAPRVEAPAHVLPPPPASLEAPLPEGAPARAAVQAAIARITPALAACDPHRAGHVVELRVTFAATGRVTSAVVVPSPSAQALEPAERSCLARTARTATTEPFALERFEVTFPVRL